MLSRAVLIVLIVGNALVLLGQLWPEGVPSFARQVNIAILVANVLVFGFQLGKLRPKKA